MLVGKGVLTAAAAGDDWPFGVDDRKFRLGFFRRAARDNGVLSAGAVIVEIFEPSVVTGGLQRHLPRLMDLTQAVDQAAI